VKAARFTVIAACAAGWIGDARFVDGGECLPYKEGSKKHHHAQRAPFVVFLINNNF
jgi:hypothetical protein